MRLLPGKDGASASPTGEAQRKQGNDNAESTKDIDEALQQGKHRPDKIDPEVDAFWNQNGPATNHRDLPDNISPWKAEHMAHSRIRPISLAIFEPGDRARSAVAVVEKDVTINNITTIQ